MIDVTKEEIIQIHIVLEGQDAKDFELFITTFANGEWEWDSKHGYSIAPVIDKILQKLELKPEVQE